MIPQCQPWRDGFHHAENGVLKSLEKWLSKSVVIGVVVNFLKIKGFRLYSSVAGEVDFGEVLARRGEARRGWDFCRRGEVDFLASPRLVSPRLFFFFLYVLKIYTCVK